MAIISASIDVLKIDKNRLKKFTKKDGSEALFLDVTLIETPDNKYGEDYMVVHKTSKEERDAKVHLELAPLGNAKIFDNDAPSPTSVAEDVTSIKDDDDVPF